MFISNILLGSVIGGACVIGKEIYRAIKPIKELKENEIASETWEELWKNSGVGVKTNDGYYIPALLGTYYLDNGIRYLFKYPVGLSSTSMEKCAIQIKELANADRVEVTHHKDDLVYINVLEADEEEEEIVVDDEIKQSEWDELWGGVKKYVTNDMGETKTPKLVKVEKWACGKSYFFKMPVGLSTHEIKKVDIAIKEFLGALRVVIKPCSEEKSMMEIKSYTKPLPSMVKYQNVLRENKDELEVVVGQGYEGWARLKLLGGTHNLLIGGAVGTGKSVATNGILTDLALNNSPEELAMYICDLKVVELPQFQHLKHCVKYVYTVEDLCEIIDELTLAMWDRYRKFLKMNVNSLSSYNEKVPKEDRIPYIMLVIEEIMEFSTHDYTKSKKYEQKLATFLSKCRGAGMGCICTTQRGTDESIPRRVRAHLCNRILFKTSDENESRIFTDGKYSLSDLKGNGHGILISGSRAEEFQGFFLNENKGEVTKLLKDHNLLKE